MGPAGVTARAFLVALGLAIGLLSPSAGAAPVSPAAIRETTEYVMRQFAKEAAEEGEQALARRIESLAGRCGDDALVAARKVGPRGLRLAEQAGDDAPKVVSLLARRGEEGAWLLSQDQGMRLFLRHGDDAAQVMLRHKGIAGDLIGAYDRPAIDALAGLSQQNGRRLAMMAQDGTLAAGGRPADLLGVIGRYGDRGMDFVWRNKGALAAATVLAAFVADPQPFIDGTRDLVKVAGQALTQPATELARGISNRTNWTIVLSVAVLAAAIGLALRGLWRRRRSRPH
jgi:hypothetical protein